MFASKQQIFSRNNRLQSTTRGSQRAITPNALSKTKNSNVHYSQSKRNISEAPPIQKQTLLTPINQQIIHNKPYYLGKGNNHEVIRRALNRRQGWGQTTNQQFVYLRWVQNSQSFKFHLLGKQAYCFNHFQYHRELSNKQRLVQNLVNFCQSNKLNAYNFLPVTYIIDLNTGQQDLSVHAFVKFYNRNHPDADDSSTRRYQSIILPRVKYTPYYTAQQLNKRSMGNFYCKPYFPKSFMDAENKPYIWILKPTFLNRGRGVALFRTLQELQKLIWKYYQGEGLQDFQDKPSLTQFDSVIQKKLDQQEKQVKSVQLSQENTQPDKNQKVEQIATNPSKIEKQVKKQMSSQNSQNNRESHMASSQPCIKAYQTEKQESLSKNKIQLSVASLDKQYQSARNKLQTGHDRSPTMKEQQNSQQPFSPTKNPNQPKCLNFVIQKYIQQPMLIGNKKFDIRVWVLLTHNLQVFIFEQAYLRFSSHQYSTKDNHNNPFIHLTNNSVQKHCQQYDKSSGNQYALSDLQKYIQPAHKAQSIYKSIKDKIRDIVWLSMCSVRRKININSRKVCFELFGYDFMVDKDYKTWLIQVNTNPALDQSGPLLRMLVPRMIDDMFKLTIDKMFTNKIKEDAEVFVVEGQDNQKNMWQFLGDLKEGGHQKNGRRLTFVRR